MAVSGSADICWRNCSCMAESICSCIAETFGNPRKARASSGVQSTVMVIFMEYSLGIRIIWNFAIDANVAGLSFACCVLNRLMATESPLTLRRMILLDRRKFLIGTGLVLAGLNSPRAFAQVPKPFDFDMTPDMDTQENY